MDPLLNGIPEKYKKLAERVIDARRIGKNSYYDTVRLMCCQCVGFEYIATRIKECNIKRCALWHTRRVGFKKIEVKK